jgi:hypothetical protein
MAKKCRHCGQDIPEDRWGSAWYCSEEHYYAAKMKRSNDQYANFKGLKDKVKKNEAILEGLLIATKCGATISFSMLVNSGFDLGFTTGEVSTKTGKIWKMVGEHAYHIDPETKNVNLWKR